MDDTDIPSTFDAGRILVVDDDQQVRQLLRMVFSTSGFDVVAVANGEQALQSLAQGGFDLVILDVHMPGMSGTEVLRQVRASKATRATPVILLTGEGDVASRVQGLNLGASDYVVKPFEVEELVARVHSQVQSRHAWRRELDERLRERVEAVRALAAATSRPLIEDRASAIVDNLVALPPIDGAIIVWLTPEGSAVPLALAGDGMRMSIDRPLSIGEANYLSTRASVGPWLTPHSSMTQGLEPELADRPLTWAPIGVASAPDAVLGVAAAQDLTSHDLAHMLAATVDYAAVATGILGRDVRRLSEDRTGWFDVGGVIEERRFTPHFQPIVDLRSGTVVGYEALTRFTDGVRPDQRFALASRLGLGIQLEQATLTAAIEAARALPAGRWLSVNVSPAMIRATPSLARAVAASDREIVLEITEHDPIEDYAELHSALRALPDHHRLSIDDAGAGFASLRHILILHPAYIKLDNSWALNIDTDPARQALVAGLLRFAAGTEAQVIAEGIETPGQHRMMRKLGVSLGQGYLLGPPRAAAHPESL